MALGRLATTVVAATLRDTTRVPVAAVVVLWGRVPTSMGSRGEQRSRRQKLLNPVLYLKRNSVAK